MKQERMKTPDLPGLIHKDLCFRRDADKIIGKYAVAYARNGRKVVKILGYDPAEKKATYEVVAGLDEQVGKQYTGIVEENLLFEVFEEDALSIAMVSNCSE